MKKLVSLALVIMMLLSVPKMGSAITFSNFSPTPKPTSTPVPAKKDYLCEVSDFLLSFNLYAAFIGTDHMISTSSAEITRFSDSVMIKSVFHQCEILSLTVDSDIQYVTEIRCTLSTASRLSSLYMDDFVYMLMEALMACEMESSSISEVMLKLGIDNNFQVGDSGEIVKDGIKIKYSVTKAIGISFTIECTK